MKFSISLYSFDIHYTYIFGFFYTLISEVTFSFVFVSFCFLHVFLNLHVSKVNMIQKGMIIKSLDLFQFETISINHK